MAYANNTLDKFGRRKSIIVREINRHNFSGVGLNLSSEGNYDFQGKKITNVSPPDDLMDVVTLNYLSEKINEIEKSLQTYTDTKINEDLAQRIKNVRLQLVEIINSDVMPYIHKKISEIKNDALEKQITIYFDKNISRLIAKGNIPHNIDRKN